MVFFFQANCLRNLTIQILFTSSLRYKSEYVQERKIYHWLLSLVVIKHLCLKTFHRCLFLLIFISFFKKNFLFFTFRETYVEQKQGENSNDRNDRAIRVAAKWYNEHLKKMSAENQLQVIFITNDRKNKEKAIEEGIPAFTCKSTCINR